MTDVERAVAYFEEACTESDEILKECSEKLKSELLEQKAHFVVALQALHEKAENDKLRRMDKRLFETLRSVKGGRTQMKIYIAGKITCDPGYKAKFEAARAELERQGYTVLSPSVLPVGLTDADYMHICFAMIERADAVTFLPDYTESRGGMLEWMWCHYIGKQTMYLKTEDCHERV